MLCVLFTLQSCFCFFNAFPLFRQITVNKSVLDFGIAVDNCIFNFFIGVNNFLCYFLICFYKF